MVPIAGDVGRSRGHAAPSAEIEHAASMLRAAGHDVSVEIDDAPAGFADLEAARIDRMHERADRMAAGQIGR